MLVQHTRRLSLTVIVGGLAVLTLSVSPALADRPIWSGQPDNDTYIRPRTVAEAAFEQTKLGIAAAVDSYASTGSWASGTADLIEPDFPCPDDCGGGGGGNPPTSKTLPTYARRQSEAWWCGPASGQVVINYSRDYFYSSLNGDSASTNWRTQTTIADWMNTTQSAGTTGQNLTDALNRTDAVQKPFSGWVYLYVTNADGAAMHDKVVTDVWYYSMPLVIAVKPHKDQADYYLPSWPNECLGCKHWITIRGYDGFWDGTDGPDILYNESSGNGGMDPGAYRTGALTMWKVNHYNASTMVW